MGIRLRLGPFSISSRGRVGVRVGPVSAYGGGRGRRRTKARQGVYALAQAPSRPAGEPTLTELHAMPSWDRRMLEGRRTELGLRPRDDLVGMRSDDMRMVLEQRVQASHAKGQDAADHSYLHALKHMGAHDRSVLELTRADLGLPRVDDLAGLPPQDCEWILSLRGESDRVLGRRSELRVTEATKPAADSGRLPSQNEARHREPASAIELFRDTAFALWDATRLAEIKRLKNQATPEQRLESLLLITNLWSQQCDMGSAVYRKLLDAGPRDSEILAAKEWLDAWTEAAGAELPVYTQAQAELVTQLGTKRAEEIADSVVAPKMEALEHRYDLQTVAANADNSTTTRG